MAKGKLFGFLVGLFLGATALMFTPKTAKGIDGFIYRCYNDTSSHNTQVAVTVNNGSSGTQSYTVNDSDLPGYWAVAGDWIPPPSLGDTIRASFTKTVGGKTYETHTRRIYNSSDLILPTVFLDDTSKNVKAQAVGTWKVKDNSTGFTDTLRARAWLKKNPGQKINFVNYLNQFIGVDSTTVDTSMIYPQIYINLEKQDSTWTPNDSVFVEVYRKKSGITYSNMVGFKLDTLVNGCATMKDSIIFDGQTPNGVEMSYFGAMPSKNGIKLEWETQSSLDSYLWEILRGQNNDSLNYDLIATQPGDGNSNQPKHWYYDDTCAKGINYYKLAEVDFSGLKTFYGPFSATAGLDGAFTKEKFKAFPNPTNSLNKVKVDKAGKYSIYNLTGQKLGEIRKDINGTTSSSVKSKNPAGVYFLKQDETGDTKRIQVVK
ncbi:T9SS type A sorting domain-containing protein [Candidatus Pacearchaeota archaeon]|nr:T9SS type A sorting domain-containing protein [Candidatus Pacearchaeota archaeon]